VILALTAAPEAADASERATVLIVVGAAGEAEYGRQFAAWAARWEVAAKKAQATVQTIGLASPEKEPDRDLLAATITKAAAAKQAAALWIVLIGHGTFDGKTARFNLRGPDVSAVELAQWLKGCERPTAIIDCAAASGPFLQELSAPNRVVITATRSGHEHNFARLGDFLSAAIADPAADLDKDEQTSLLEAFLSAAANVQEFYAKDGRLVTEHALLDDNGDKLGTPSDWFRGLRATKRAKDGGSLDGLRASQLHLVPSTREEQLSAASRARRDAIERDLELHRQKKSSLEEADYYRQIEPLLIELARLYASAGEGAGIAE